MARRAELARSGDHGRNASTSAAENRQETASNVQPGLALPAII
jgi:hypothetical protein